MLLPESQTRAVLIHRTARGSCLQSNKQSCVHMQVPVKCMKFNQDPVLGCVATDSVSAEFSLDVSPFANKSSRDARTFCGVRACEYALALFPKYALALFPKYALALFLGPAVVTRHQGLQPTPA